MNKKKVMALLATTVLGAGLILPLAACGDTKAETVNLNLGDYIQSYTDAAAEAEYENTSDVAALTKLNKQATVEAKYVDNYFSDFGVVVKSELDTVGAVSTTVYRLYNVKTGAYVNSSKYTYAERFDVEDSGALFFRVISGSGTDAKIAIVDAAGDTIFNYSDTAIDPEISYDSETEYKINGVEGTNYLYTLTYTKITPAKNDEDEDVEEEVVKYYYAENTVGSDKKVTYTGKVKEVTVADLTLKSVYEAGDPLRSIYEREVDGDINNYKYTLTNGTYDFYNGTEKTDSITLTADQSALGFLGDCLYYYNSQVVSDSATKGYNVCLYGTKYNYTYYKYNILTKETTEFTPAYAIKNLTAQYNYTTKQYDAAVIYAYAEVDDVAQAESHQYLVDSQLRVAMDLTKYDFSDFGYIFKVSDERFIDLYNGIILDDQLNALAQFYYIYSVYPEAQLLLVGTGSGFEFVNYDCELSISQDYNVGTGNSFYGGYTYAYKNSLSGEGSYYIVSAYNGSATKVDTDNTDAYAITPYAGYNRGLGLYIVKTANTTTSGTTYNYTVYNFGGRTLSSSLTGTSISVKKDDGKIYVLLTYRDANDVSQTDIYLAE
jgi:hypothetical protein